MDVNGLRLKFIGNSWWCHYLIFISHWWGLFFNWWISWHLKLVGLFFRCLQILIECLLPTWRVFSFYRRCLWWSKEFINNILLLFLCIFLCLIEDDWCRLYSSWSNRCILTYDPRCCTCTWKVFMARNALVAEHIATSWCYAAVHSWRR